jgi:hypothetical protein
MGLAMSIVLRLLIVAVGFAAATVAAYFAEKSLGIAPGGWQHALSIGCGYRNCLAECVPEAATIKLRHDQAPPSAGQDR